MSTERTERFADIWNEVSEWSAEARHSLANRILQSLEHQRAAKPRATPADLIGVWDNGHPPDDEEVEQILKEEKMRKYG